MATGYSTPSQIKIEYDNAAGSLVDISQFVMTLNDVVVEQITEETHSFGDLWEENIAIGIGKLGELTLGGLYDDQAGGPDSLFAGRVPEDPNTATRTLKITWRTAGKTTTFETFLASYTRKADRGALTKYEAKLLPTGSVVEA